MINTRNLVTALLAALVLFCSDQVLAAIVYVDNSRACPGNGSSSSPYCSIQNALNAVQAGDTIRIRTGTGVYSGTNAISGRNGTAANPIVIEPDVGHEGKFVLRNTNTGKWVASLRIKESDFWTVRGLTFDGADVFPSLVALHVGCDTKNCVGIHVVGNTFRNWRAAAGHSVGPMGMKIEGCHVHLGCSQNRTITAVIENNLLENIDRQGIGLSVNLNTIVRNNEIRNIRCGRGDDQSANTLGMHLTFANRGMQIYQNYIHSFVSKGDCPITSNAWHATTAGIWVDSCRTTHGVSDDCHIFRNRIHGMDAGDASHSMTGGLSHASQGLFIEAGCQGWTASHNTIYNIGTAGIRNSFHSLSATAVPNRYFHNTIFNIANKGFWLREGAVELKNNIFRTPNGKVFTYIEVMDASKASLVSNYNIYDDNGGQAKVGLWGGGTVLTLANWRSACNCDRNSLAGNPQFVDEISSDFRLHASSPARGSGEGGVDMGAYPYEGGGQVPNAPAIIQVLP